VDQQRASQGPDGSYDVKDSHAFLYEALSKELFVGNVYLRVYNDQPDFEISEPEAFCVALIDFISFLVNNQFSIDSDVQNILNPSSSSPQTSEVISDTSDLLVNGQLVTDDSMAVSDGKSTDKGELDLVKNFQFGLTSLKVHY
jgi:DnaJ family protein C protein 13